MDDLDKPEAKALDAAYVLARAGISLIPIVGSPALELLSAVISSPLDRRRERWLESIAEGLKELEKKVNGFTIESLSQNDVFITTVIQASQIALRSHQREKLEGLRNAVLNSALPDPPEEDQQLMFLNFVDTFTVSHVRIIKFSDNPRSWIAQNLSDANFMNEWQRERRALMDRLFPGVGGRNWDFYNQVLIDLKNRGLVEAKSNAGPAKTREASRISSMTRAAQAGNLMQAFQFSASDDKPEYFEEFVEEAVIYQMSNTGLKRLTLLGEAFVRFLTSPV